MAVFLFYIVNDALHANPMPFPGSDRNTVGKDGRCIGGIFFQNQQMPGAFKDRQVNTAVLAGLLPKLDYWKEYDELSDNGQFETAHSIL